MCSWFERRRTCRSYSCRRRVMGRAVPGLVQEREGPAAESVLGGATAMASGVHHRRLLLLCLHRPFHSCRHLYRSCGATATQRFPVVIICLALTPHRDCSAHENFRELFVLAPSRHHVQTCSVNGWAHFRSGMCHSDTLRRGKEGWRRRKPPPPGGIVGAPSWLAACMSKIGMT